MIGTQARASWLRTSRAAALCAAAALLAAPAAWAQDELLLNDDRIARNQWAPVAAVGTTGALIFGWQDGRNGTDRFVDYDIYAMAVRGPAGLGTTLNRRVNDDGANAVQSAPDMAGSRGGTVYCVWEDGRTGNPDIFGAALDSLGVRLTPNLRINDDAGGSDQRNPRVAPVAGDRFLVVWGDQRAGESDVFASFRTLAGAPIGSNIILSVDPVPGGSFQGEPAVAADSAGLTLVVWLDQREGGGVFGSTSDVYAQWLDPSGNPIGGNFKVNDTSGTQRNASPAVAADPRGGGFVVAWIDRRTGSADPGDVYAQRYSSDRAPLGPNVRVNDDPIGRDQRYVRAVDGGGAAMLFWEDVREIFTLDPNVEMARVPYDGSPPGANMRVNSGTSDRQGKPGAVWDGRDAFLAVWEDSRNGPTDIYAISIDPTGARRGLDTQLNDDAAAHDQWNPRLGKGNGQYLATWIDRREGADDLYGQWVTSSGGRDGANFRLWHDTTVSRPLSSDAAVLPGGRALVAAALTRDSDAGEIRGFLLPVVGVGAGPSFWVSDSLPSAQTLPSVAPGPGEFAVAWIDSRLGTPLAFGQRLDANGIRIGGNVALLPSPPAGPVTGLDLGADPGGGYRLLYAEGALLDQRLWMVHLDAALVADGPLVEIAPGVAGGRVDPAMAIAGDGRVEVTWAGDGPSGYSQVFHQAFDAGSTPLGPVGAMGEPGDTGAKASPSVAVSGNRSIVTWQGRQNGDWSVWLQILEGGVNPESGVLRVDQDVSLRDQIEPTVGFDAAGRAIVVWDDDRSPANGADIIARVFDLAPTSVTPLPTPPGPDPAPPGALLVGPARPNPFSGVVGVSVETRAEAASMVRIDAFNVHGERVATVYRGPAPGGRLRVAWDGTDAQGRTLPSGVYWLRVESGGERRGIRVVHVR